jgi:hypothetical protein
VDECVHGMDPTWCATCSETDDALSDRVSATSFHGGERKQDVLNDITDLLGLPRYILPPGGGSSLPSAVFDAAAHQAGVPTGSMPEVCESVVRKAGHAYSPSYDSRATNSGGGSTVTLEGIQALRKALLTLM